MKISFKLSIIAFTVCSLASTSFAEEKPQAALEAIKTLRADRKSAEALAKAKASVKDIDPATVNLADAAAWVDLFTAAQDYKGTRTVAARWADKSSGVDKFKAQVSIMGADSRLKDMKGVADTLDKIKPPGNTEAIRLASLANNYIFTAFSVADTKTAMKILTRGEAVVPKKDLGDEKERAAAKRAADSLAETRKLIEANPGKELEALQKQRNAQLAALLGGRANAKSDPAAAVKAREERDAKFAKFIGQDAAEIKATKVLGEYKSMANLKGKVVVLDFFAHWCGPCKMALPSVRVLYDDLKTKGLAVVGVTRFYGSYAKEKGLTPETEYERMKDFVVEQKINWPVAFVGQEAFQAYGASAIPHVVVIDKTGKIRKIKVGYNKAEVEAFHKEIEALLAS